MSIKDALEIIYQIAITRGKMTPEKAAEHLELTISFHIGRLNFNSEFSMENFEKSLIEDAEFHLKCQQQDVA